MSSEGRSEGAFAARVGVLACIALAAGCVTTRPSPDNAELVRQVRAAESAFAKTMADRDHAAFSSFLADDAVFFNGPVAVRGRAQVAEAWKRFYAGPQAPFSWEPAEVVVLDSGALALSSGPVRDPRGKQFATFTSIWRLEAPGTWRIVFDKGGDVCDCAAKPSGG